jgi:Mg2+ and Co2+ transporter CorA
MEQKNSLTINLSIQDHKDLMTFCELNEIKLVEDFVRLCFRKGYYIEKYGLLNQGELPEVIDRELEKEVIREVIVEKEVFIEKSVIDNTKIDELQNEIYILKGKLENQKEVECGKLQETLMNLNRQLGEKNDIIKELRNKVEDLENLTKTSYAFYLKSSNLKDRL